MKRHTNSPASVLAQLKNIAKANKNALPNGIICLKGGDLQEETRPYKRIVQVTALSTWFDEPWFKEKYCIYLPA